MSAASGASRADRLVIGLGNRYRGDDALGLEVAEQVRRAAPPGVEVREEEGEPAALIELWVHGRRVFVVDAVATGAPPGTITRIDAHTLASAPELARRGTHAFGLGEVIELARALGRLPDELVIYGVEGERFDTGAGLSRAARRAVGAVVEHVLEELASDDEAGATG
jgi:hydrogenase maturation protease